MADAIFKTKVQLRTNNVTSNGSSTNGGEKTPTTPTTPSKLMINHGKPNFTIQRSPKVQQNGDVDPFVNAKNNNYNPYKKAETQTNNNNNILVSTKFNGAFKPANVPITPKQPHQANDTDNEAAKVVLRRAKVSEPPLKDGEDDAVPEFIRRQRRIQERLAKENILDFESRRSGYFTHVMISPTSPNRMSFGATMSSPPVVPALETQTPAATTTAATTAAPEETKSEQQQPAEVALTNGDASSNGHHTAADEEEVAKAIEEVNKAVAGEDDELKEEQIVEPVAVAKTLELTSEPTAEHKEEPQPTSAVATQSAQAQEQQQQQPDEAVEKTVQEQIETAVAFVAALDIGDDPKDVEQPVEKNAATVEPQQNGHVEVVEVHAPQENGQNDITISHTNGFDGPSIPAPDPSGALGVNYEPKTVVSFSKELSSEPNKYPDTVKVVKENDEVTTAAVDEKLQELSKLKFDIKADEQDVQVTPVLRTD